MFAGHRAAMDESTRTRTDEQTPSHRRVRTDLKAGSALLAVVIVGNLVWRASDTGIISAFAGR
jgi:hypothetical protein